MTNGLSSPKAAQGPRAPEAAPEAARGAPPPSDAFAGILGDAQQARTATAEGQSPEKPMAGDDCASSAQPVDQADTPAPDATAAVAAVMAALPVPVAPEAPATAAAQVDGAAPVAGVANPVAVPAGVEQIAPVAQQVGAPANIEVAPVVTPGVKPEAQVGAPS